MLEKFGDEVVDVDVLDRSRFGDHHHAQVLAMVYRDGTLRFTDSQWRCRFLGSGEEKASFVVCDHQQQVFTLEIIDERSYLNGRFITGEYFGDFRVGGVSGLAMNPDAVIGLRFTGLVKARQYVPGYVWERFQWRADRRSYPDVLLTRLLQGVYATRFGHYRRHYRDVHERNVMFELRPPRQPGVPLLIRDHLGRLSRVRVGLQPVDLR